MEELGAQAAWSDADPKIPPFFASVREKVMHSLFLFLSTGFSINTIFVLYILLYVYY